MSSPDSPTIQPPACDGTLPLLLWQPKAEQDLAALIHDAWQLVSSQPLHLHTSDDLHHLLSAASPMNALALLVRRNDLSPAHLHDLMHALPIHRPAGDGVVIILEDDEPEEADAPPTYPDDASLGAIAPLAAMAHLIHLPIGAIGVTLPGLLRLIHQPRLAAPQAHWPGSHVYQSRLFQSVIEGLPLGIIISHDPSGRRCTMNPAAAQMLALPLHANPSPLGQDGTDPKLRFLRDGQPVAPHDLPFIASACTGKRVLGVEYTLIREDGTKLAFLNYTLPLLDHHRKLGGAFSVMVDVTDRKRMESALTQSQSHLKLAFESANAGSWEWNLITGEMIWSDEFRKLHGLEQPGPVTLDRWASLVAPSSRQTLIETLQTKRDFQLEYRLNSSPRQTQWVVLSGRMIRDSQGRSTRLLGIGMDITDHKLAEQSLRENASRFRTMVDASPLGVFITGPQGDYQYVNARLKQFINQPVDTWLDQGLLPVIHPEDRAKFESAWLQTVQHAQPLDHLCRIESSQGQVIWLHLRATPVMDDNQLTGIIGTAQDITKQRQAQAELGRSQHRLQLANATLAQRNEDMEELLSITAHDLKHPIVGIQGLLTLLKEDCYDKLDEDSQQNLDLSLGECDRMKEMLSRLSKLGRIEQARPRLVVTQLQDVVDTCVKRYQAICQQQAIQIRVQVKDKALPMPQAILVECLGNLIDNAIKYGCQTGMPTIDVSAWSQDRVCHFRVRDYGPGIDPIHHDRVFKPFRRLVSPSQTSGSGIGLTAVKRLIQRVGGKVTLISEAGKGCCFEFTFPCPQDGPDTP